MKQNSWHFKLHKFLGTSTYYSLRYGKQVGLCEYFWKTIIAMLLFIAVVGVCSLVLFATVLNPIIYLFTTLSGLGLGYYDSDLLELGMIFIWINLACISWIGAGLAAEGRIKVFPKWFPVDRWVDFSKLKAKFSSKEDNTTKEPSLILQYLKAKKDKFCPMLKLED